MRSTLKNSATMALLVAATACGGGGSGGGGGGSSTPVVNNPSYSGSNSLAPTVADNVTDSGQASRLLNLIQITSFMDGAGSAIQSATLDPTANTNTEVRLQLLKRYEDTGDNRTIALAITNGVSLPNLQANLNAINPTNRSLLGKTAGNDTSTDHKAWATPGNFKGWADAGIVVGGIGGIDTPENLIRAIINAFNERCVQVANNTNPNDPDGSPITDPRLTPEGRDLRQLLGKLINMSVFYSQMTDDYLDTDMTQPTKGLLADNMMLDGTNPYTAAEHQWDEGFGYFGAARDYLQYSDDEVAQAGGRANYQGAFDTNNDGFINLDSEINLFLSTNAAKRDRGSDPTDPTDFSRAIFLAFVNGRRMISAAAGRSYSTQEFADLEAQRDIIRNNVERVIAATIVHYINDVLQDMDSETSSTYFADISKHFSEMKGFALGLQFNPAKLISQANFETLHTLIGDAPVLKNATTTAKNNYRDNLRQARAILGTAYGFSQANLGDADGTNGW